MISGLHLAGTTAVTIHPGTVLESSTSGSGPPARAIRDGPYADTKEQIGGTFALDLPELDAALAWAEKCPEAQCGTVEIRPSVVRFVDGRWVPVSRPRTRRRLRRAQRDHS